MSKDSWTERDGSFTVAVMNVLGFCMLFAGNIFVLVKRIPMEVWGAGFWFAAAMGVICIANILQMRRRIRRLEAALL